MVKPHEANGQTYLDSESRSLKRMLKKFEGVTIADFAVPWLEPIIGTTGETPTY